MIHLLEEHQFKYQANTSLCNNRSSNLKTFASNSQNQLKKPLVHCLFDDYW